MFFLKFVLYNSLFKQLLNSIVDLLKKLKASAPDNKVAGTGSSGKCFRIFGFTLIET